MENSPSPAGPEVKIASPPGTASAFAEIPVLSAGTPSAPAKSSVADATKQPSPANDSPDSTEKVEYNEFEFSNYWEGKLYFVHIYEDNIAAAVERVVGRRQDFPVTQNPVTGNWFFVDDQGTGKWCIKVKPVKRSFTTDTDYKPSHSERLERRSKPGKVDNILDGLI